MIAAKSTTKKHGSAITIHHTVCVGETPGEPRLTRVNALKEAIGRTLQLQDWLGEPTQGE